MTDENRDQFTTDMLQELEEKFDEASGQQVLVDFMVCRQTTHSQWIPCEADEGGWPPSPTQSFMDAAFPVDGDAAVGF